MNEVMIVNAIFVVAMMSVFWIIVFIGSVIAGFTGGRDINPLALKISAIGAIVCWAVIFVLRISI